MSNIIEIENLHVQYPENENYALSNINLKVKKGEFLCVMGPAGAGKTTLALCLNGLIPNSIKVKMKGKVTVKSLDTIKNKVSDFAKYVGIVFQDPDAQLFCSSVEEEVGFVLSNRKYSIVEIRERVHNTLSSLRLEGFEDRIPQSLSGGEKQLVAIASVLSIKPEIIVLDEPTSQLDPIGTSQIFSSIKYLSRKENITVIMTEHKSEEIAEVADRIVLLNDGKIVLEGTPTEVFRMSKLLDTYGVRPPQVSEAADKLKSAGIFLPEFPVTLTDGVRIFQNILADDQN